MLKQLSSFLIFFVFSMSTFAALNESTKPDSLTVYLNQNLPYSGFNDDKQAIGLYAEYWQAWSAETGIPVTLLSYPEQGLSPLLASNDNFIYDNGLSQEESNNLLKTNLFNIKSNLFYFPVKQSQIQSASIDSDTPIHIGGLLPQAQQLPTFNNANIIYKAYPGILELLIDLYREKLDTLVFFEVENKNKQESLFFQILGVFLTKHSINGSDNQLFAYLSSRPHELLDWIEWGSQSEQLSITVDNALREHKNPWWGTSFVMGQSIFLACLTILVLFFIGRCQRKKYYHFKDVLDSSPYPLIIFTLDGNAIHYLNEEVKSLFPFKKKKDQYFFEDPTNQLLLSSYIKKVSHQTVIENGTLRLIVDDIFRDIEIIAKRTHYKNQTAWLCHLKDVTALLRAQSELNEERELLRKVLDSIPEQISFKSLEGAIIGCNTAWAKANNTTVAYATGRRATEVLTDNTIHKQRQQETSVWMGETYNTQEWIQQPKSPDLSLFNVTKVPLYNDIGNIFAILSIDSDITAVHNLTAQLKDESRQRKKTERALSKQSVLLSTVFAASYDPIGLLDHEGRIIGANSSFAKLMNASIDDIIGKLQSEVLSADREDWADRQNKEVLNSGEPIIFEELLFSDNKRTWYEVHKAPFHDEESNSHGIVIMARDITTHKLTEEKLSLEASDFEYKMLNDKLTNIANRRAFDDRFDKLWKECVIEADMLSIVMCDIDFFKLYNDNYGHQKGDEALKYIASTLQKATNEVGGFVARYGGEEFVIIIKGGNATKVLNDVKNIHSAINETQVEHLYSEISNFITMSMGISNIFPTEFNTKNALLAEADAALYEAKMSGRNNVSVH